jgi:pimeloyl-ACP methyl ester carboxylesterase
MSSRRRCRGSPLQTSQPAGAGTPNGIAETWVMLMERLGYPRYVAQSGDWGAFVTTAMAQRRPSGLAAIHLNFPQVIPDQIPTTLSPEERRAGRLESVHRPQPHKGAPVMQAKSDLSTMIRNYYRAYETKDRATIETLLAPDFRFSSPLDDRIDRETYFSRCWPNSERIRSFTIERIFAQSGEAFVQYELQPISGDSFRNVELFLCDGDRIREVVVFFGRGKGTVGDNA